MSDNSEEDTDKAKQSASSEILSSVAAALAKLSYGAIQLTVHNGRVVQLDITERRRFQD